MERQRWPELPLILGRSGAQYVAMVTKLSSSNQFITITAEIHARSLTNFYCQCAERHMNLKFMRRVSEREPAIRQFGIAKKQIDVSF